MTSPLARPVICLVTDGRRSNAAGDGDLLRLIRFAAAAGVTLIQIRERRLNDRRLLSLTRAAVRAVAGTPARVVVNDRVDVALAANAAGVHLRADSPSAARVRSIVPAGFLIGRSVHGEAEAVEAAGTGVDYLILGTVYPSASKEEGSLWLGEDGLARGAAAVSVPLLAIGGVTADNVGNIAAAGAAGFAAIGLFANLQRVATDEALDTAFRNLVANVHHAFRAADGR